MVLEMINNYTQDELNKILIQKNINDFYIAIIENRGEMLTDEEYNEIANKDKTVFGDNKEEVENLINDIKTNKQLKNFFPDIMKLLFSVAQVRHLAILTMIGDDTYNIANGKFEDLKRNKVIRFDNLTSLYSKNNARVKLFTPEEEPQLTQNTVLIDIDDESIIYNYEKAYIHQEESEDLTSEFLKKFKDEPKTLKKNKTF